MLFLYFVGSASSSASSSHRNMSAASPGRAGEPHYEDEWDSRTNNSNGSGQPHEQDDWSRTLHDLNNIMSQASIMCDRMNAIDQSMNSPQQAASNNSNQSYSPSHRTNQSAESLHRLNQSGEVLHHRENQHYGEQYPHVKNYQSNDSMKYTHNQSQESLSHMPRQGYVFVEEIGGYVDAKNLKYSDSGRTKDVRLRAKKEVVEPSTVPTPIELHRVTLKKTPGCTDFGFGVSDGVFENGVYLSAIRPGGPAERSGQLQVFDRILQVCVTK